MTIDDLNAWMGHYVYREDDTHMEKEEYDTLQTGDVIENNKTKSRYVVIPANNAGEPITQIKKDDIKERITEFTIVMRKKVL